MMELLEAMLHRRSIRRYSQADIPEEKLEKILQAGLLAPTSKSIHSWQCIVVRDRGTLEKLSACRDGGHARMLSRANCAVAVVADTAKSDVWIEDCAVAMANMHLMADSLGVGSCWVQGRLRTTGDVTTDDYVRDILHYPDHYTLAAILSLGMPESQPQPHALQELATERIHREQF